MGMLKNVNCCQISENFILSSPNCSPRDNDHFSTCCFHITYSRRPRNLILTYTYVYWHQYIVSCTQTTFEPMYVCMYVCTHTKLWDLVLSMESDSRQCKIGAHDYHTIGMLHACIPTDYCILQLLVVECSCNCLDHATTAVTNIVIRKCLWTLWHHSKHVLQEVTVAL